jgi:Protein of unknown function (DUF3383)
MAASDLVQVEISIANASSPSVQALNTPLIATYHTHYSDRVRVYDASSMLADMVTDGFSTSEAGYKCAEAMLSAPNTPSQICIGRRANPPLQTLNLACVDGTVGDAYNFTLVGSDGKAHAIAYINEINPGTAASGTVTVANDSTALTFQNTQSLAQGGLIIFDGVDGQPGIYYALASAVSGTSGTLTTDFQGIGGSGISWTYLPPLAGTADAVNGSATVVTSTSQVGALYPGDSVQFVSQLGAYYTVLQVTSAHLILTQPYTGQTAATTKFAAVCTSATAASAIETAINGLTNVGTASVIESVSPTPNAGESATVQIARTDGFLNDIQGWVANGFASIQIQDVTEDPGITADLTAIRAANNGAWYGFTLDSNSQLEIEPAAEWTEATLLGGKVFFPNNSDWQNTQTSVTTDVFSSLQTDSYSRTFLQQNDQALLCYSGGATCSQALAMNPGSYTLAYKTLPGVPADSDTTLTEAQAMALNSMTAADPGPGAKNGNYYKTVSSQNWLFPGTCPSGRFMDLTIGIDWLYVNIQASVLAAIAGLPKLPFTDIGIGAIKDAIDGVLRLGSTSEYGLILPDGQDPARPIVVNVPTAASLTSAQRATRNVPGITFSAGLQGAIETTTVQGTLIP